jgi:hypothetical protein
MALASDGTLLLNIAMTHGPDAPEALLERALARGGKVFIGVALPGRHRARLLHDIDDAALDVAGRIGPATIRPRGKQ